MPSQPSAAEHLGLVSPAPKLALACQAMFAEFLEMDETPFTNFELALADFPRSLASWMTRRAASVCRRESFHSKRTDSNATTGRCLARFGCAHSCRSHSSGIMAASATTCTLPRGESLACFWIEL